jgi:hypothetical protein
MIHLNAWSCALWVLYYYPSISLTSNCYFVNEYQNGNGINKCEMSIIASFANKALAKKIPRIFQ